MHRGLGKSLQALAALAVLRIEKELDATPVESIGGASGASLAPPPPLQPFLVVCPAAVALHWEDEVRKYFPPDLLRPLRYSSLCAEEAASGKCASGVSNRFSSALTAGTVCIVSYEMLRNDFSSSVAHCNRHNNQQNQQPQQRLCDVRWEAVVLDEAQCIKNPATAAARAVFALRSRHRIALSGTPVQNQIEELWSLMNFLLPDYLGKCVGGWVRRFLW